MYDQTAEPHEFVGEARAQAVQKACDYFRVGEDELEVFDLDPGEVYGAAGRAVVVAVPRGRWTPGAAPAEGRGRGDRERPERGGRPERGERQRRERRDRPGRDRGDRERSERGERSERAAPRERVAPAPSEPTVATVRGELTGLGEFVQGLLERMDLGPFEISETLEDELAIVEIGGAAAEVLGTGDGRTVDAIQLLANQAAVRIDPERQRVVVDVEGNAEAREELLTRLAGRVASRARQTGRAIALDPMNGRDRRLIHLALRDAEQIATMSVGEGRYRQVLVVPEGAPEYEEARQEAERAQSRDD